jgi:predicted alpha/beta superfamily hydrolase
MAALFLKSSVLVSVIALFISCKQSNDKPGTKTGPTGNTTFQLYSTAVSDSFYISVQLPNEYSAKQKYPVLYLLDANIYFDIMAATISKYNEIGLAPAVILVGIGYKDFQALDSLRNRDDTYPIADTAYEMPVSGGAEKFLTFINTELIPQIDKAFHTDTTQRVMMGHSLGGYFTSYTLLQQLLGKHNKFSGYIAVSPSLHYNQYYLLNRFRTVAPSQQLNKAIKTYFSYGELEDEEDDDEPPIKKVGETVKELNSIFAGKQTEKIKLKCDIFSNLAHMDTPIPGFLKGLQWTFTTSK